MSSNVLFLPLLFVLAKGQVTVNSSVESNLNFSTTRNADICSKPATLRSHIFSIFTGTVAVVGTLGNAAVVFVVAKYPKIRQRNRFLFLASLAVADAGVSVFVTAIKSFTYSHNSFFCGGIVACVILQVTDTFFPICSMMHVLVVCVDRWYAIALPYKYIKKATTKKARIVLLITWVYSLVWVLLGTFKWNSPVTFSYEIITIEVGQYCLSYNRNYVTALLIVVYFIPIVAICVLSHSVVQKAKRSKSSSLALKSDPNESGYCHKTFKAVTAIITVYIICWLPHCITVLLSYWWLNILTAFRRQSPIAYDIITTIISNILPTLNSCVNPFIYSFLSREFQIACKDLVLRWSRQPRYWSSQFSYPSTHRVSRAEGLMLEMADILVHKHRQIDITKTNTTQSEPILNQT